MSEKKHNFPKEECLQSRIRKELLLTSVSLAIILLTLAFWEYSFVSTKSAFPIDTGGYKFGDLVNTGLQRQLFWGVVALTSFIGFFQFLEAITSRKSFSWLYRIIFGGFTFALTFSIIKIADHYQWVAELEKQGHMPIELEAVHNTFLILLPVLVPFVCLFLWFLYLCLFIEKMTKDDMPRS